MIQSTELYSDVVNTLTKPGDVIKEEITPINIHLLHMAVGISGEAGELLDTIKKTAIYNKPIDRENIVEELGDLEFYMQGLRNALEISRLTTIDKNIIKLNKRYSSGSYSNTQAQERADKTTP